MEASYRIMSDYFAVRMGSGTSVALSIELRKKMPVTREVANVPRGVSSVAIWHRMDGSAQAWVRGV